MAYFSGFLFWISVDQTVCEIATRTTAYSEMHVQKTTTAIGWSALDQVIQQTLFFAISVTLARLVSPEAYGTVALLQLFTGLAGVFINGGLTSALIQKKDTTHIDETTVFWFNTGVGALMGVALFLGAPWISRFYEIAVLLPITQLYACQLLLAGCNSVHYTLFTKRLDFKTPLKIATTSTIVSAAVGIYLAWKGMGVWALVAQSMTSSILGTLLVWLVSTWRPSLFFSSASFRSLFRFGGYIFLSSLLDTFYLRFYNLILGKLYGAYDLGIYNRADSTKQLPTSVLTGIISRVAFPIYSRSSADLPKLLDVFRLSIRGVMFLNIPMMLGVAVVAEPLILTLFGRAWAGAIPLLQILAIGSILWPLHVLNLSVLMALGHSSEFLRVELVKKGVGIALVVLGACYGMQGMAWAVVISSVFSFIFNAYYNGIHLNHGAWRQVIDFSPALLCGILMAASVLAFAAVIHFQPLLQLLTLSTLGAIFYLILAKALRVPELNTAIGFAKTTFSNNRWSFLHRM